MLKKEKIYIDMDFDGLRSDIVQMLGGGHIKVNTLSFQNDMSTFVTKDDVLTLLIHLGYPGYDSETNKGFFRLRIISRISLLIHLGYPGYDSETKKAFIPNREILGEFENAMSTGGWTEIMHILKSSEKLHDPS